MCYTEPEIEEERRLLYVAITRAKERCFLSYSKTRFRWGSVVYCMPSRFLNDIDERYLDVPTSFNQYDSNIDTFDSENSYRFPSFSKQKTTTYTTEAKVLIPISEIDMPDDKAPKFGFVAGDRVMHATFGSGSILEIIGYGNDSKARVDFDTHGQKTLLLKYSKLQKI